MNKTASDYSERAYAILSFALDISLDQAKNLRRMYDCPEWDSEGQLSIVLKLEEETGASIADEQTFERLTEVSEIAAFLRDTLTEDK